MITASIAFPGKPGPHAVAQAAASVAAAAISAGWRNIRRAAAPPFPQHGSVTVGRGCVHVMAWRDHLADAFRAAWCRMDAAWPRHFLTGLAMTRLASNQAALSDRALGSLMAAAQDGDGQAYQRLLAAVAVQAMEACTREAGKPAYGTAEVEAFACNVLHTVHAALPTFDPRHSFHAWLDAIISVRLAQFGHRQRVQNRRRGGGRRRWYRRLVVR